MARRKSGASQAEASRDLLAEASMLADTVLTAVTPDHLLYAYLNIFLASRAESRRTAFSFLVTSELRPPCEVLHSAFIQREQARLDPFILGEYGPRMSAWAESRWLYWLDRKLEIPSGGRFWFVPNDQLHLVQPTGAAGLAHVGRGSPPNPSWRYRKLKTDTSPWTFHSTSDTLNHAIRLLSEVCAVVLFHNEPADLDEFINEHDLEAYPLAEEGLELA
jgi:hypothetical protein